MGNNFYDSLLVEDFLLKWFSGQFSGFTTLILIFLDIKLSILNSELTFRVISTVFMFNVVQS